MRESYSISQIMKSLWSIQSISVFLLIAQATSLVILMRYSRIRKTSHLYATTTVVFSMEIVKFISCLFLILVENSCNVYKFFMELQREIIENWSEMLKVSVPAILFTVQTNLLYVAISRLDVVTHQAISQVKILTTAFFSVTMLNKSLSITQWISCIILSVGVTLTQITSFSSPANRSPTNEDVSSFGLSSNTVGMCAVFLATITSGFSSVYFEKILKNGQTSIWIRNLQMSFFSIIFAAIGMMMSPEWDQIVANGSLFYGYNGIVLTMICLQAMGGLVVAVVMKYTDNIIKGFANSVSIGLSWLFCVFFFEYEYSFHGMIGMILIMIAVCMYSASPTTSMTSLLALKPSVESDIELVK